MGDDSAVRDGARQVASAENLAASSRLNVDAAPFQPGLSDIAEVEENAETDVKSRDMRLLKGSVEGVSVPFLCDTGADSTVLSSKYFARFPRVVKAMFQDSTGNIWMPDGRRVTTKGPVLCNIEVGGRVVKEIVYLADIGDQALLGWDAQLALGVQYSVAGIDLTRVRRAPAVYNPVVRHVKVTEECVIPPRSEFVVKGRLPQGCTGDVMVSSIKDINESRGLVVARTVVDGRKNQCCVRVLNLLDEPRVLHKGNLLCRNYSF